MLTSFLDVEKFLCSQLTSDPNFFIGHWVATLGKLFTHGASAVSQLQETGGTKRVFGAYVVMVI